MTTVIYSHKLNSINTLTVEIEETFSNTFSVLAFDDEGGVWEEYFVKSYDKAVDKSKTVFNKILKQY